MKKIITLIGITAAVTVVMTACSSNAEDKKIDATEMAQFEAWKAAQEKPVIKKKSTVRTVNYQSPVMKDETQNTAKVKKGWSKAAKGAAIGAASGAVIGAVVNKRNRAAGAVIGGVVGGGGGYVIGRTMDKKDGRY
jgi:Glycine zipper